MRNDECEMGDSKQPWLGQEIGHNNDECEMLEDDWPTWKEHCTVGGGGWSTT
jgi:hypothetical protein